MKSAFIPYFHAANQVRQIGHVWFADFFSPIDFADQRTKKCSKLKKVSREMWHYDAYGYKQLEFKIL